MEHGRQPRGSGTDCISDLPDALLHGILLHLCSTRAAARTSALSRRWRRVWESLPDLVLVPDDPIRHGTSFFDTVDGALAAYTSDPAILLRNLKIFVPSRCVQNVSASRVAAWLFIASRRLAGVLHLHLGACPQNPLEIKIELPPFERATGIVIVLRERFLLRLPPAGAVFAALADLDISLVTMDARELEVLVSSQCPSLRNLNLIFVTLVNGTDISISSDSLRRLKFQVWDTRRLDVSAPNLGELNVSYVANVHVAAPNLAELISGNIGQFVFADPVRHLRLLEVTHWSAMAQLMRRLDTVDELRLHAPVREEEFQRFIDDTNNLPKCEIMSVSLDLNTHGTVPTVLHLLKRGSGIKKLAILLTSWTATYFCPLACPCRSPQSAMPHDISLDSLEGIEFHLSHKGDKYVEILKQLLCIGSVTKLKNVEIDVSSAYHDASSRNTIYNKVRRMCPPNIRVGTKCVS